MTGIEMMLRSLGVDPEEIKGGILSIAEMVRSIDARLTAMDEKIDQILESEHGTDPAGYGAATRADAVYDYPIVGSDK